MNIYKEYADKNINDFIKGLKEFLRFPSISTNPENKKDVLDCAEYRATHVISGSAFAAPVPGSSAPSFSRAL